MEAIISRSVPHVPWNRDKLTGQKSPLKLKEIWAIRIRLQLSAKNRDLAMFNLAIDSKLRACDLTKLRVRDVCIGILAIQRMAEGEDPNEVAASFGMNRSWAYRIRAQTRGRGHRSTKGTGRPRTLSAPQEQRVMRWARAALSPAVLAASHKGGLGEPRTAAPPPPQAAGSPPQCWPSRRRSNNGNAPAQSGSRPAGTLAQ